MRIYTIIGIFSLCLSLRAQDADESPKATVMINQLFNEHGGPAAVTPPMVEGIERKLREEESAEFDELSNHAAPGEIKPEVVALVSSSDNSEAKHAASAPMAATRAATTDSGQSNFRSGSGVSSNRQASGWDNNMNRNHSPLSPTRNGSESRSHRSNNLRSGHSRAGLMRTTKYIPSNHSRSRKTISSNMGILKRLFSRKIRRD